MGHYFLANSSLHLVKSYIPRRMGYLRDTGLCVELVCEERDPLRVYHNPQDPVCRDSALEAFFAFGDLPGEPVRNDGFYCNFELNANGAMYAKLGRGRKNRRPLTPEEYALCAPRAQLALFWLCCVVD